MNDITQKLIYKTNMIFDWMNDEIINPDEITYHHINKKCDGGKLTFENGAVLTKKSHTFLNILERKPTHKYYETINTLFIEFHKYLNNEESSITSIYDYRKKIHFHQQA